MAVVVITDCGSHFQYTWSEQEKWKHINWLELRAARYTLLELASPGDVVQFHIDNMMAITFIRRLGGTHSLTLKQLSEKTAFLVAFSTLSRYGLVSHLTKMSFPKL